MELLISETCQLPEDVALRDAAIICCVRKIEQLEIISYESLYSISKVLGFDEVSEFLLATLEEENFIEKKLMNIEASVEAV